jgi:hydrogenase-4 transcriptional activator
VRPLALTPDDVALLAAYPWPGNIRELASVIDRAVILGEGGSLEIARALGTGADVRSLADGRAPLASTAPETEVAASRVSAGTPGSLDQAVRGHIEAALAATGGRIEGRHGAARLLAINPHTLRARMRKLGIDWSRFREAAF